MHYPMQLEMKSNRSPWQRGLWLALAALLAACGGTGEGDWDEAEAIEEVEQMESALSGAGASWDQNGGVVDVCFVTSGFAAQKALVRDTINATWGANSGLTFRWPANLGTDKCTHSSGNVAANFMPVHIRASAGPGDWGGVCQVGYGGRMNASDCGGTVKCQCAFSASEFESDPNAYVSNVATHEIGHGLGLPHEHQRSDRPANIATTCVDPNNASADWVNGGNYKIDNNIVRLTQYDGLESIMSYCRDMDQNGVADFPPTAALSQLDVLGIEMKHPKSFRRKPMLLGGIANADGSSYIVRSDVSTKLNVDWVRRGALTSAISNVSWADDAGVFSTSKSPSITITTQRKVKLELDDVYGRHHSWTETTAVPSNARHTAVVMAAIAVL